MVKGAGSCHRPQHPSLLFGFIGFYAKPLIHSLHVLFTDLNTVIIEEHKVIIASFTLTLVSRACKLHKKA